MTGVTERARSTATGAPPARTGLRRWLWAAVVVVLVILVIWVVAFSRVLGVSSVRVSGTSSLSAAQVRKAADITAGTPLVRLDTAAIERRVAALPAVRTVTVRTSYPSTVSITVTERTAVGYRDQAGVISAVDVDDVAFRTLGQAPKDLPSLLATGNDQLDSELARVAAALTPQVASRVARISAASSETVTLVLRDGRTVLWGGTDSDADKARLLPALLGRPGTYFDISDPSTVISR